jgi:hypothetical protein
LLSAAQPLQFGLHHFLQLLLQLLAHLLQVLAVLLQPLAVVLEALLGRGAAAPAAGPGDAGPGTMKAPPPEGEGGVEAEPEPAPAHPPVPFYTEKGPSPASEGIDPLFCCLESKRQSSAGTPASTAAGGLSHPAGQNPRPRCSGCGLPPQERRPMGQARPWGRIRTSWATFRRRGHRLAILLHHHDVAGRHHLPQPQPAAGHDAPRSR